MKRTAAIAGLGLLVLIAGLAACRRPSADAAAALLKTFADPPSSFRSVPLWVWNDAMTQDEVRTQLEDFKARGIGGVFIHPRPGLITPYLSPEWMSLCKFAVETGKSLGLEVWIYDENSYPSGFGGGHVPAQMPDAGRAGLRMTRFQGAPKSFEKPPAVVLRQTAGGFEDMTGRVPSKSPDNAVYYVFDVVHDQPSPWFGNYTYVDIMRKDVTEKFLDVTLNAYKGVIGTEFGRTVPGVFQDEAEISPAGGPMTVNYTPALFQAFQAKWGYDLKTRLVSLFQDVGEWRRVRHNFYSTLLDLFIENWAKPYYAYCAENNLQFTGHYWDHAWPNPEGAPDNLAMAAYAHRPGVDILMNVWDTGPHAQFGNDRAVREIRSAANQRGRTRTLSETYGASGWDLGFFDQKRIGDWEYALGVNFLNQHLSYATIKGARKRDHPLSFSYHEPWWKLYNTMADYFGRLSVAMSAGQQVNTVLVLEPTTSAWLKFAPGRENTALEAMGGDFQTFIHLLEAEHIEYDLASEKTLEEFASVKNRKLVVGERAYTLILLPPGLENLNNYTVTLLREYLMIGGKVVSWVAPPDYVDGKPTEDIRLLAASFGDRWFNSGPGNGIDKIKAQAPPKIAFSEPQNRPWLYHQRREFDGGQLLFLANVSPDQPSEGRVTMDGGSVEEWDLFTGRTRAVPFDRSGGKLDVPFSLAPGGSLLLCVRERRARPVAAVETVSEEIAPSGELGIVREAPNVLTLDYCDLVLGGKTEKDLYFYDAQKKTYAFHGLGRNPWDSAVQYKTNILDKDRFSADSGFEATFWFNAVKADFFDFASIRAVVERPELFKVSVNGREVQAAPGEWWLDRAFGVFPIGPHVKAGRNRITVKSRPFTIHSELEPVYILGDFRVEAAARGFELRTAAPLVLGAWPAQGLPLYGHSVVYRRSFELPEAAPLAGRYILKLGTWRGAVAEVRVGGRTVGVVLASPGEIDITDALKPGANEVAVAVYGSLRNTLGPFHNAPPKGSAWPGNFQRGAKNGVPPGAGYSLLEYGMFDDLKLERRGAR